MNKLQSRSFGISEGGSIEIVRKAMAELLIDAARFIASGDIDTPSAIIFKVKREHFDLQVVAEFQSFNPEENLI